MSAALRLETFRGVEDGRVDQLKSAALERAYQEGYSRGLAEGREASLDQLASDLGKVQQSLASLDEAKSLGRRQATLDLVPLLGAIVDTLGVATIRSRLLTAIGQELGRFSDQQTATRLHIRCHSDLSEDLRQCIKAAGCDAAIIDDGNAVSNLVEMSIESGSIVFDPESALRELRDIIDELKIED